MLTLLPMGELMNLADWNFGPAMRALPTDGMRRFVLELLDQGGRDAKAAAAKADYKGNSNTMGVTAHRLMHDERVQAALHEEATKRLRSGTILSVSVLSEIIESPSEQTKDRLKAIEMLLNRTGLHAQSEHKVTVEHTVSEEKMIARIQHLAGALGLDPKKLLGSAGVVVDAEFTEVSTQGLEDLL